MSLRKVVRQAGFGILEAIVALTLLAGTGAALYAWLGTNLRAASALAEASARAALQLKALEILETVNPANQLQGRVNLKQIQLEWKSQPAALDRFSVPYAQGVRWRVGLYRTLVTARDAETQAKVQFEIVQVGLGGVQVVQPAASSPAP